MEQVKIPNHVAIIMDGNGRWAEERGLARSEGHKEGYKTIKTLSEYILSKGVKVLSVFAFSTENFKRSAEEVDYLMNLFVTAFNEEKEFFLDKDIKILFSGSKENLKPDVIAAMEAASELTKDCRRGIFNICLNYGGQQEIVDATNKIIQSGIKEVTCDVFAKYLYQDLPPIDLLIRTSGEERISNFMLWQLAYAELYFSPVYFPSFNAQEFDQALILYSKRDRRFGDIKK